MPATIRSALLSALRRPASTDADLLAAFASARDEAAFAELVHRHGRLVLGASLRAVGDRGTAEDVFQATFLLLARKADSISWGPTVGPWLYQAVRRIGAKARAGAVRRSFSPLPHDMPASATDPSAALARAEMRAALDDALAALPADLRDPLVLCYLEGMTQEEAAAALRCTPTTIKGRVTRGRERLREVLERRGVSLSVAMSGVLVSEAFVSAGAAATTARAAMVFATTGAASPKVLALLGGTSAGVKLAAGLFGLVLACAAVAGLVGGADAPKQVKQVARAAPPARSNEPLPAGAVARLGTRSMCGPEMPLRIEFSPDGKKVAALCWHGVTVWDAATGRPLVERKDYDAHRSLGWRADGTGVAVVYLKDRSYFVSAFTDPDEKLPTPTPVPWVPNIKPGPDGFDTFALSPDGTRLAVVRDATKAQFTVEVLLAVPGRPVSGLKREQILGPFDGPLLEVCYMAGGNLMLLTDRKGAANESSLSLLDPVKKKIIRTTAIPTPAGRYYYHLFRPSDDGARVAIVPKGGTLEYDHAGKLRLWDLNVGKEIRTIAFAAKGYAAKGYAFSPDGKRLITSSARLDFQVWEMETGKETARSPFSPGAPDAFGHRDASSIGFSRDGKRFATGRQNGQVDIWHTDTGKPVVTLDTHRDIIDAVAVSPDGRLGATRSHDGTVRVWELATGKPACVIAAPLDGKAPERFIPAGPISFNDHGRDRGVGRVAFSPDGSGLLFPADGKMAMASPATGKRLELPRGLIDRPGSPGGFSADGKTLMTFAANKVEFWDWPSGNLRRTLEIPLPDLLPGKSWTPQRVEVYSATLSPDGRFVFVNSVGYRGDATTGGFHSANDLWDARTGKRLHQLTEPLIEYPPAAFSPDGRVMYLGGRCNTWAASLEKGTDALTAWEPATGKLLRRFYGWETTVAPPRTQMPLLGVDPLAVSPDGRLLAVGTGGTMADRGVWVYETASGKIVRRLEGHAGPVTALVFTPDGRRLVSARESVDGLVWDVTVHGLAGKQAEMGLADAWAKLAETDPASAYGAMAVLIADPAKGVPLLRERLNRAPASDADVDKVIARLDAASFAEREKASADLERLGPNAVRRVEARLAEGVSVEARRRLERFLHAYTGSKPSPHDLRSVRGVAVVEAIGTPAARALLVEWAKGPKDDTLTREARSAELRLGTK